MDFQLLTMKTRILLFVQLIEKNGFRGDVFERKDA